MEKKKIVFITSIELWSMATKHLVAVLDRMEDVRTGQPITIDQARVKEIFGDLRNYLLLEEAMLTEMIFPPDPPTV